MSVSYAKDYESRLSNLYVHILGLIPGGNNTHRKRKRHLLELYLNGEYLRELFIQESASDLKQPPHTGLEHLSFFVEDGMVDKRSGKPGCQTGPVRADRENRQTVCIFYDPDGTKLELYQAG